jgi:hypothetical protein
MAGGFPPQPDAGLSLIKYECALLRKDLEIFYLRLTLRLCTMVVLFGAVVIFGILASKAAQRARAAAPASPAPPMSQLAPVDRRSS